MNVTETIHLDPYSFRFTHRSLTMDHFPGYYHFHPGMELLYIHQGSGNIVLNQRYYPLKPGLLFCFQPFQLHKIHVDVSPNLPYERTLTVYEPQTFEPMLAAFPALLNFSHHLWTDQLDVQVWEIGQDHESYLLELFQHFAHRFADIPDKERQQTFSVYLLQLLEFMRSINPGNKSDTAPIISRGLPYSEMIMLWIEEHYAEDFKLEELANRLHLSKHYVSRLFHRETGTRITDYLIARRMKQACLLLNTTLLPVESTGIQVGIHNFPYFCQLFKKIIGLTPHQYRVKARLSKQT